MMHSDEDKSERLWTQIEEIKQAGNTSPTRQDLNRARNGAGLNGLNALSQAVYAALQAEAREPAGQDSARSLLLKEILAEQAAAPAEATGKPARRPSVFWNRQALLIALLLLIIAASCFAIWYQNRDSCQTPPLPMIHPQSLPPEQTAATAGNPNVACEVKESLLPRSADVQDRVAGRKRSSQVR